MKKTEPNKVKSEYFFLCACGCGTKSEVLGKDGYVRLVGGQKWYVKDCVPKEDVIIVRAYKNGLIVKREDF